MLIKTDRSSYTYIPSRVSVFGLTMVLFLCIAQLTSAENTIAQPLDAKNFVPAELLKGSYHQVDQQVVNNGFINTYSVNSDFGKYKAQSTLSLKKLVHEINMIAELKKVEESDVFIDAMKQSGKNTAKGIKNLFTKPEDTIKGAATGIKGLFGRAEEAIFKSKPGETEDSRMEQFIGLSKAKGGIANKYGLDAYSRNRVLREQLDRVANADYFGGLSVGLATSLVSGGAGVVLSASGAARLLNESINLTPPAELRLQNRQKLEKMRLDKDVIQLFVTNPVFSPRQQTLLVTALEKIKGAENRAIFIKIGLVVKDPFTADIIVRMAIMFSSYHNNVNPIKRFHTFERVAYAESSDGTAIVMLPADHITWNKRLANGIRMLKDGKKVELWSLGSVSDEAHKKLTSEGWTVKEKAAKDLKLKDIAGIIL